MKTLDAKKVEGRQYGQTNRSRNLERAGIAMSPTATRKGILYDEQHASHQKKSGDHKADRSDIHNWLAPIAKDQQHHSCNRQPERRVKPTASNTAPCTNSNDGNREKQPAYRCIR